MEVAGQWRREWAGTAEYGKVTEGGVTRQVARAMEVLHASAPGARVRVLRAAYHSTAGPGAPASSYLLHSTRRVISSGYNFIEPETSPSKPLEISSMPLESSPELELGSENYKVTEPDDLDISEPSKWRGSKSMNSIRMPSEESSSTDNASIIDLDYNNRNTFKKNSEKMTTQTQHKRASPISSLLDTPVTLSTLKYKSLLNGNDSWNNRRKSYSFEETPELDESILRETDTVTMESSTDSGICKSSEIVNSENCNLERKTKMEDIREETFKDWLSKNRKKNYANQDQSKKEHIIGIQLNNENNITLQSAGKVSITLPTATKAHDYFETKSSRDDYDKITKKVEFCKTELHFAAESGTVNIIATDEKPPPSNDFRKKRSVFVPMTNDYNKSITLFGEKDDDFHKRDNPSLINEINTIDENTAATKGILKNKIPKPKPYLLGENMVFGNSIDLHSVTVKNDTNNNYTKPTGVSLINKQLQLERTSSNESKLSVGSESDWRSLKKHATRTSQTGPVEYTRSNQEKDEKRLGTLLLDKNVSDSIKTKVKILQMSPTPTRAKTRQLRESDLTYFGVTKTGVTQNESRKHSLDSIYDENNLREEILHSVQLVKLISNSVCNSEVDSDEAPDYANVPVKNNFIPKPAPRSRSKCHGFLDGNKELKDLNPILEKDDETVVVEPRRVKVKRHIVTSTSRSLSEPPNRQKSIELPHRALKKNNQIKHSLISKSNADTIDKVKKNKKTEVKIPERKSESPLYVNLDTKDIRNSPFDDNSHGKIKQISSHGQKSENKCLITKDYSSHNKNAKSKRNINNNASPRIDCEKHEIQDHDSERKKTSVRRTKVLVTPEKSPSKFREISSKNPRNQDKNSTRERKEMNHPVQKRNAKKIEPQNSVNTNLHSDQDGKENNPSVLQTDSKALKNCYKLSSDATSTQNFLKDQQEVHSNVIVADIKKSQPKTNKRDKVDKTENNTRRSKYVINYDDKNGTVSSICKIRPDHGSTKKKKIVNYDDRDSFKNHTVTKTNSTNKNNLLQPPDQQRILYGNYKMKSKFRAQQSCQIL